MMRRTTLHFPRAELRELGTAWAFITLAFAILYTDNFNIGTFIITLLIAAFTVGTGFIAHELAHKFTALHYGCTAYFKANRKMLYLAVIISFFGFIFAAPGAVYFQGHTTKKQRGHIALAGPAANIALALLFLPFAIIFGRIAAYGAAINAFLALFNLLPIPGLDGYKVLSWNKWAYGASLGIAGILSLLFFF